MLAYVRPMLAKAYVRVCWPHVGVRWPYVEPSWRLCWAHVGDMLAMLGLCCGDFRQFIFKNIFRYDFL